MHIAAYKHYLAHLRGKTRFSPFQKILIIFSILTIAIFGVITSLYYYQYTKEAPLRTQNQFLDTAIVGFNSTEQSFSEMLASYQVAGAKINSVPNAKQDSGRLSSSSSIAFFTALDGIEKTIAQTQLIQKNVISAKDNLLSQELTDTYDKLHQNLINFYDNLVSALEQTKQDEISLKEIIVASGPNFYLPNLTQEGLWEGQKKEEIINFYQNSKEEADTALADLAKIKDSDDFLAYYQLQITYLERLVNLADNIINTMSQADLPETQEATQIEKSYQLLVGAERENEETAQKILAEKLRLFDAKKNLAKFAPLTIAQNSIKSQLTEARQNLPRPKNYWQRILQGLQIT